MRLQGGLFPVLVALLAAATPAHAADKKVAIFDFELVDTSLEGTMNGQRADQSLRLRGLAPALRRLVRTEPGIVIVDTTPVVAKARARSFSQCPPCASELGRELGADIVITGTVQKVSNLILNINAYGHDVVSDSLVAQGSVDIRGNNDEMWRRGLDALWKNILKKQFAAIEARR